MELAVWAAFFGGAFGWIIRSVFDIFYIHKRDKRLILNLIRADLASISSTANILKQEEYLNAVARYNSVGKDFTDKLHITASIRASVVDTRIVDRFGDALLKIEPKLQTEIVALYRGIVTVRLLMEQVFKLYESDRISEASVVAAHTLPILSSLKKKSKVLLSNLI